MADVHRGGATAGLRGAYWEEARLRSDVKLTVHPMRTQDGQVVSGYLLARGDERVAALLAHPREHLVANYLALECLDQGCAAFLLAPRIVGNDIRLEHEIALFDVAAAIAHLRALGFEKLVSVGFSGGGPLLSFYNQQALADPARRIATTPGGRPTKLAELEMVPVDVAILVSSHLGQGLLLANGLDPSVIDEADALATDPALDPFDPANGFAGANSRYTPAFQERFRAAQLARVARIDAIAREHVAKRQAARRRLKDGGTREDRRLAAHTPIFPVWRTDADLRCWDLTIDPSDRRVGSLWGTDPATSNLGSIGFGRVCTAESWLSTWSGISSNASMQRCAPALEQPTLMIEYTGDACTFPADNDALFGWIGTSAKERLRIRGDHHGRPILEGDPDPRPLVGHAIGSWLPGALKISLKQREQVHVD